VFGFYILPHKCFFITDFVEVVPLIALKKIVGLQEIKEANAKENIELGEG